jgi:hypothetical protein
MSDGPDLEEARVVVRKFDLGPLPTLDLDEVMRRGLRRRRGAVAVRFAVAAVMVAVAAAGFATVHARGQHTPSPVSTVSPTPTPSPSTMAGRVLAVMDAITAADSVHVVVRGTDGTTLDVVVTKHGAQGTLTYRGNTYTYFGAGGALYIKGKEGFNGFGVLNATQVAAERGRWVLATQIPAFNDFMNLKILADWFYPEAGVLPTLGQPKTINGTSTFTLVNSVNSVNPYHEYIEVNPPYRPVLVEAATEQWTFSDWNAHAPTPSAPAPAPAPADVYNPQN